MINKPNLFHWATSELSQDAFICWLLSWANHLDDEYYAIKKTADYFIHKLIDDKVLEVKEIEIIRQYKSIDILCKINNEFVLLIEDKVHANNHSNQLERYYLILSEEYEKEKIIPVFFKTGDHGEFNSIKKVGYKSFLRKDFLNVLEYGIEKGVDNHIFIDFYNHLKSIEESSKSFQNLPVSDWHWDSWKGFYTELAKELGSGEWNYVPQKNGGFLGFWWCWHYKKYNSQEFEYYLQLEHGKFCFKLYPYERENAEDVREYYREILFEKAKQHDIEIYRNGRIGNYMTVAALNQSYIKTNNEGFLDLKGTIELVRTIEKMIIDI